MNFTNPRLMAVIEDFPLGGSKRGRCTFAVETSKKGIRVSRVTFGKPKFTTYGGPVAIVDGEDGRTYILQFSELYGFIKISRSDFIDAPRDVVGDNPVFDTAVERFAALKALIDAANQPAQGAICPICGTHEAEMPCNP